jgi:hypothetical protein
MVAAQSRTRVLGAGLGGALETRAHNAAAPDQRAHTMSFPPEWPADPGVAEFDALQEDPARWIEVVSTLGARYSSAPAVAAGEGTVLVAFCWARIW